MTMETLAHQGHLASWVSEVCKVCLERKENLDGMVRLEQLALLDHLEKGGCLACQEFLDQKDIGDFLDWMVQKERWVVLV